MVATRPRPALTRVNGIGSASRALFEEIARAPLPHWEHFQRHVQTRTIAAGGTVFMQGVEHPFAYVVKSGLIKNVYLRVDGETWIKSFAHEGRFFASIAALKRGGRTSFTAVCIERSAVERFPFSALE